jgi:hypothetical protein
VGRGHRLGCPAGSVHLLLPVVFDQEAAEPMPGGLPGLQRHYQSTLWKLWSLRLLSDVDVLLQRHMHGPEFRSAKLRRLRIFLPRIDSDL